MIPAKYIERAREIQRHTPWYELQKEIEALLAEAIEDTREECMKKCTVGEKKMRYTSTLQWIGLQKHEVTRK